MSDRFVAKEDFIINDLELRNKIWTVLSYQESFLAIEKATDDFYSDYIKPNKADLIYSPFLISFNFDYEKLQVLDKKTLDFLISEPTQFEQVVKEIITTTANKFLAELAPKFQFRLEQIHCLFRLGLPLLSAFLFDRLSTNVNIGLTTIDCVVGGFSVAQKYM